MAKETLKSKASKMKSKSQKKSTASMASSKMPTAMSRTRTEDQEAINDFLENMKEMSKEPSKDSKKIPVMPEGPPYIQGSFYLYLTPEKMKISENGSMEWTVRNATKNRWVQFRAHFEANPGIRFVEGSHGFIRKILAPGEMLKLTLECCCEKDEKLKNKTVNMIISNTIHKTVEEVEKAKIQIAKEKPVLSTKETNGCPMEYFKQNLTS